MRHIRLHGALAELAGKRDLHLAVENPLEAVRAICQTIPGARFILESSNWRISVGGESVNAYSLWHDSPGTIDLVPTLEGAGPTQGQGFGKIIFGLFLVGFAFLAPAALGGLVGLQGAQAAAFAAGTLKFGALVAIAGVAQLAVPMPEDVDIMGEERPDARTSYLFTSQSNLTQPGQRVPLVYGYPRCGSIVAGSSTFVVDTSVPDEDPQFVMLFSSDAYLRAVDVISEGTVGGVVGGQAGVYLDDVPVETSNGLPTITLRTYEERDGSPGQTPMDVEAATREVPLHIEIKRDWSDPLDPAAGSVEFIVTDPNVTSVHPVVQVPLLWEKWWESPFDPARHHAAWAFQIKSGDGAWQQVTDQTGTETEFYDPSNVAPPNPSTNRTDTITGCVEADMRAQTGWIGSDPGSTTTIGIWYRTLYGPGPWIDSGFRKTGVPVTDLGGGQWITPVQNVHVDGLPGQRLQFECRSTSDPSGNQHLSGDIDKSWNCGEGLWGYIDGGAGGVFERESQIILAPYGPAPWTIRVYANKNKETDPTEANNTMYVARYRETITGDFLHADTAYTLLEVDAEDTGGRVPRRTFAMAGIEVEVPTGYDPDATDPYAGMTLPWDGTFDATKKTSSNPAWILRDLALRIGLTDAQVDKWALFDISTYCDELIYDGQSDTGEERRFEFHHQFLAAGQELKILQTVAASARIQPLWGGALMTFVQDKPTGRSHVFNQTTVLDGRFEYVGVANQARYTAANVTYRNAQQEHAFAIDNWRDKTAEDLYGVVPVQLTAIGVTSAGQARRHAKYTVLSSLTPARVVRFRIAIDGPMVAPGDVVQVYDDHLKGLRNGGRIKDWITSTRVRLDKAVTWNGPLAQNFITVDTDGEVFEVTTTNAAGESDIAELGFPPTGGPIPVGWPWVVAYGSGSDPYAEKLFRVQSIDEESSTHYLVEATEYASGIYGQIEKNPSAG